MDEILKSVGRFESFDGTEIYYESRGQGEPIVFIYGIACLMNHWHHQVEFFSRHYQVITFDLRAHHNSAVPKDPAGQTVSACVEDVKCLIDHLGLKSVHLVGHSFGVPVAVEFAGKNNDRLKSLSLINGFVKNPIKNMFGLDIIEPLYKFVSDQYLHNKIIVDLVWKKAVDSPITMWGAGLLGGFNLNLTQFKDIEIYARGVSQISLDAFIKLFGDMMNFNGEEYCKNINTKTLVIAGENDKITPVGFQSAMSDLISNSHFVLVPYGSHCTQLDFPDYTNLLLEKHFKNTLLK
jgi:pimeloyl-ACP methyl ester carboxylesterase